MKFNLFHIHFKVRKDMALTDPVKFTGWEKWINRFVTAALAVWQAVQYLMTHWAANPPQS